MNRPKFSKIYFPGLISLVFLPLMCIWYLISNNVFQKYQAMSVAWENKEGLNYMMKHYKWPNMFKIRNYKELIITGEITHDALEFKKFEALNNQLIIKKDIINGVSISFGNHSNYAEVVNILDILNQNNERNLEFFPIDDKILIYYYLPPTPKGVIAPTFNFANDVIYNEPKQPFISLEKVKMDLTSLYKTLAEFWPSVLAFILMLGFIILKKRRYLNLKTFRLVNHQSIV